MAEKNTTSSTSIAFTPTAKQAFKRLAVREKQRNIVSAGVIVFERLTDEQRRIAIDEANGIEGAKLILPQTNDKENIKKLWDEVEKIAQKVGVKIQMPN